MEGAIESNISGSNSSEWQSGRCSVLDRSLPGDTQTQTVLTIWGIFIVVVLSSILSQPQCIQFFFNSIMVSSLIN